jgi:hypothetical protein
MRQEKGALVSTKECLPVSRAGGTLGSYQAAEARGAPGLAIFIANNYPMRKVWDGARRDPGVNDEDL